MHLGDGPQGVPVLYGVSEFRVADDNRLPNHQLGGVGKLVIINRTVHRDLVLPGQTVEGISGLHHMNVHFRFLLTAG